MPFDAKWAESVRSAQIPCFIRRKIPAGDPPHQIYFYVKSPVMAILARATIISLKRISQPEVQKLKTSLRMSSDEIAKYVRGDSVGLFTLGDFEVATKPARLNDLQLMFNFHPPQGFLKLDEEDAAEIDRFCKFEASAK